MVKLILLMLVSVMLSMIIQYRKKQLDLQFKGYKKEIFFTLCLILLLGVFTGLRTWFNDTVTYYQIYEKTTNLAGFFSSPEAKFSTGFGFGLINSCLKTIGASSQDYIMFYGIITMSLYISFFCKRSVSLPFTIFLFFTVGCFVFSQAAIKQSLAMAIGCWSVHFAIEKKWIKYIMLVFVASLFHPYAIIFLLTPLMQFCPWSIKGYLWGIFFIMVGFSLHLLIGSILSVTTLMGANYDSSSFVGEGVNLLRVFVCLVPTVLSFTFKKEIYVLGNAKREDYILMNLTMLNGLIMFVGLYGTANYFARLANYFLPMQTLAIPWLADHFNKESKRIFIFITTIFYFVYFYYESGISQNFGNAFSQMSLIEYLGSLLVK